MNFELEKLSRIKRWKRKILSKLQKLSPPFLALNEKVSIVSELRMPEIHNARQLPKKCCIRSKETFTHQKYERKYW